MALGGAERVAYVPDDLYHIISWLHETGRAEKPSGFGAGELFAFDHVFPVPEVGGTAAEAAAVVKGGL